MIADVHDIVLRSASCRSPDRFRLTSIAALLTIWATRSTTPSSSTTASARCCGATSAGRICSTCRSTRPVALDHHPRHRRDVAAALLLFGGEAIHSFTATMMFGVVLVGTYTSVFIASPVLIYLAAPAARATTPPTSSRRRPSRLPTRRRNRRPSRRETGGAGAALIGRTVDGTARICRAPPRSRPMARAASASAACRIAARCSPARRHLAVPGNRPRTSPPRPRAGARGRAAGRALPDRQRTRPRFLPRDLAALRRAGHRGRDHDDRRGGATYNILIGERRRIAALLIAVDRPAIAFSGEVGFGSP